MNNTEFQNGPQMTKRAPKMDRGQQKRTRFPIWAFIAISFLYFELLFFALSGKSNSGLSWLYRILTGFSLGMIFGGAIELIKKFLPRKITGIVLLAVSPIMPCVEYFVLISFGNCMDPLSVFFGTGDVATGFTSVALSLIFKRFWVIVLYYLPLAAYCVFFRNLSGKKNPRIPLARIGAALLIWALCIGIIAINPVDRPRLFDEYNFDTAVHAFGITNALCLDTLNLLGGGGDGDFTDFEYVDPILPGVDTGAESGDEVPPDDVSVPIVYGKNEVDINFAALAEEESKEEVKKLHSYVAAQTPTSQNKYTGMFKGKNLILITAEAFSAELIDPEITPTLYRLANKGINFTNYYQPAWGGSTSTGEYSVLMGLVPMAGVQSIKNTVGKNLYLTIGNQLMREGYNSLAYHNNSYTYYSRDKTHTNLGYSEFIGMGNGMEEGVTKRWPASDEEMMKFTFDSYVDKEPFSIYYMTVSGHCLYNWTGNSMSKKNRDVFADMDASETIKAYYAANYELEKGLAYIVGQLEEKGMADDTVIVISTDHYPYGLEKGDAWQNDKDYLSELYGYTPANISERDHSRLIIWSGCLEDEEPIVVNTPVYSLDILPTLSNLFGLEYDSRLLVGRDVFSEAMPLVLWTNYSFLTDRGYYDAKSGKFTPNEGVEVDDDYIKAVKSIVGNKITFSKSVIALDYYNILFGEQ